MKEQRTGYVVDPTGLPQDFPTHAHSGEFWEQLGRTVAVFGFLEETLGKAIFALTTTRSYDDDEIKEAYEKWVPILHRAVSDPLGNLIDLYGKALKDHPDANLAGAEDLIDDLRKAAALRNVLCHGSWRIPDADGKSLPFFITRKMMIFDTLIDVAHLKTARAHVVELVCSVINSITHMGWQFPGSSGPGEAVYQSNKKQAD